MSEPSFPYGACECASGMAGMCCKGRGPAAFEVIRNGKTVKLCTRCNLTSDTATRRQLVTHEDDPSVFFKFDPLGAFCLR